MTLVTSRNMVFGTIVLAALLITIPFAMHQSQTPTNTQQMAAAHDLYGILNITPNQLLPNQCTNT